MSHFSGFFLSRRSKSKGRRLRRRRPAFLVMERLEDRRLLTTLNSSGVAIVDYTDDEFSTEGIWLPGSMGDYLASASGKGGNVARWDLDLPIGVYDLAVTWLEYPNRATNAPFSVGDQGGEQETFQIDQQGAPDDFSDAGRSWERLGEFIVTEDALLVELANDADGYVIAEAVRIEQLDVESPEMYVQVFGQAVSPPVGNDDFIIWGHGVENGSTIDFGQADLNQPLTASIVVTNVATQGVQTLVLEQPVIAEPLTAAGSGFTVVQLFDDTELEPGESTTAIVEFRAREVGAFNSTVSFVNNFDSPFVFDLEGSSSSLVEVLHVFDDGSSTTGTWKKGAMGDYLAGPAGTGKSTSRWEFDVPIGVYDVAVTWVEYPNRATDAPFTMFDDDTQLETVFIDQTQAPDDFSEDGTSWESLGKFAVTGDQLIVELSNDANGYVIAEAIRIEQQLLTSPAMYVQLLGEEVINGETISFGDAVLDVPVARTFKVTNVASVGAASLELEEVVIDQDSGSDFTVVQDFTDTELDPGESTTLVVEMEANSIGPAEAQLLFENNDDNPFEITLTSSVDNFFDITGILDDNFDTEGKWLDGALGLYLASMSGQGGNVANWKFDVPDGLYNVAVTWVEYPNRATDAPFSVLDGNQLIDTILVDQQVAPGDFQDDGYAWESLGQFSITTGTLVVELSNDANGYVIADAVRVEQVVDTST